ncbi:MAG: hypothetical protein ACHQ01_08460 [Candidatus Limnocylindrales bacterium]
MTGRPHASESTAAVARLREAGNAAPESTAVTPARAVARLRDMAGMSAKATEEEWAELIAATYAEITVRGPAIEAIRLTPDAYAHGFALALPFGVALARPTGFDVPDAIAVAKRIPVTGADARRAVVDARTA